jgi:triacylglycerol esterase/lipase EstA (alpha/beta hydrolase family)
MKRFFCILFFCLPIFLSSCKTSTGNPVAGNPIESREAGLPPKYPVVLVHGIVAHDRGGIINFWGRIPDILKEKGVKVFLGNTDAWGNYESNATILKETIDKILDETKSEKVNIIAHSKGGLDSRYLIWKFDYGDKVASLTTIATPHHGAEIADLIYSQNIVHTNIVKKILETFGRLYGDTNPDMFNVNHQLTTEKMKEFNETVTMNNRVYYQSLYTTIENPLDDIMFFDSYRYVKRIRGDNDGVVSEWSAGWSNNIRKIEGGISHAEIVDYKMQDISGIHIPDIYINIVNELSEMGF